MNLAAYCLKLHAPTAFWAFFAQNTLIEAVVPPGVLGKKRPKRQIKNRLQALRNGVFC
jgi:hypothetical protein